jgi:hypothetical protein
MEAVEHHMYVCMYVCTCTASFHATSPLFRPLSALYIGHRLPRIRLIDQQAEDNDGRARRSFDDAGMSMHWEGSFFFKHLKPRPSAPIRSNSTVPFHLHMGQQAYAFADIIWHCVFS